MPTGIGTALLISSVVGAGAGVASAAIQSKQQSKAVDAQQNATNQAIANLKPFQDTGTKAFTTLGALMGLGGVGGAGTPTQSALPSGVTGPSASYLSMNNMGAISDPRVAPNAAQAGAGGGALLQTPAQAATNQSATSYPSYHPQSSPVSTVTMRGPDGSTAQIPADQVPMWQQKGAVVVHG
jgi:hypothetical protein